MTEKEAQALIHEYLCANNAIDFDAQSPEEAETMRPRLRAAEAALLKALTTHPTDFWKSAESKTQQIQDWPDYKRDIQVSSQGTRYAPPAARTDIREADFTAGFYAGAESQGWSDNGCDQNIAKAEKKARENHFGSSSAKPSNPSPDEIDAYVERLRDMAEGPIQGDGAQEGGA